jgi:hypothetical protein
VRRNILRIRIVVTNNNTGDDSVIGEIWKKIALADVDFEERY